MGDFDWTIWRLGYRRRVIPGDTRRIITMGVAMAYVWHRIGQTGLFWRVATVDHHGQYWSHPRVRACRQMHRALAAKEGKA